MCIGKMNRRFSVQVLGKSGIPQLYFVCFFVLRAS